MRVLNVMTLCISTQFCLKTKRKSKELEEEKTPLFNVTWTLVLHFITFEPKPPTLHGIPEPKQLKSSVTGSIQGKVHQ